jgi:hypothetical protein
VNFLISLFSAFKLSTINLYKLIEAGTVFSYTIHFFVPMSVAAASQTIVLEKYVLRKNFVFASKEFNC